MQMSVHERFCKSLNHTKKKVVLVEDNCEAVADEIQSSGSNEIIISLNL